MHNKDLLDIIKYKNINEEITDLEKIIKEKNIKLDGKLLSSKRRDLYTFDYTKKYIIEKYEKMSFDEVKKIMDTEEFPHEIRSIFHQILLKKIRRK